MHRKRIIGVITVKSGLAVQSISYSEYFPLGDPLFLAENLDRWGVDEILIKSIDSSVLYGEPDYKLMSKIGNLGLKTPVIYAGGISNKQHANTIISLGADRITIDAMFHANFENIFEIVNLIGSQAVIASVPVSFKKDKIFWFDYTRLKNTEISTDFYKILADRVISEVLLIDWANQGKNNGFNQSMISNFSFEPLSIIAYGGIRKQKEIKALLENKFISAIAIGNYLNYKEHQVQIIKDLLIGAEIRESSYQESRKIVL